MKVAIVQFDPKIGEVQANIRTVEKLCSQVTPGSVDLVCLPEMFLSGYVFEDSDHILPYLEDPSRGPTSEFCRQLALRLKCHVVGGYAERLPNSEVTTATIRVDSDSGVSLEKEIKQVGANSALVYDPTGERIGDYRKTNLYETDMTWAKPGTRVGFFTAYFGTYLSRAPVTGSGFRTLHLPPPLNTVTLGICMDLNVQPPAHWTNDGPYEIADHCLQNETDVLIMLNAWLFSGTEDEEGNSNGHENAPRDWDTLNYWAARLRPLWEKGMSKDTRPSKETAVIVCNRCGQENGKTFAGTSAAFSMKRGYGRPVLLHALSRHQEGLWVWEL